MRRVWVFTLVLALLGIALFGWAKLYVFLLGYMSEWLLGWLMLFAFCPIFFALKAVEEYLIPPTPQSDRLRVDDELSELDETK
jgi:hypothetical protein